MRIRTSVNEDLSAIETLYPGAFPDEDLLPLVRDLLRDGRTVLSIVAIIRSAVVGHVMFTRCGVGGNSVKLALLGPLAVATEWQRKGIGSALVRSGLQQLESDGVTQVCVLGDPAYYGRLGFMPEANIIPPYSPNYSPARRSSRRQIV